MSELRWNPLLGEWVATATPRQERTFLPPPDFCPLCPTRPGGFETEIPAPDFDVVVFQNRFPSLMRDPPAPAVAGTDLYPVAPAQGECEVIVYTSRHDASLAAEPLDRLRRLLAVWTDRHRELSALPFVRYVYVFENKGEEMGVTLHHPHGQIYAYPFVPPVIERELARSREHLRAHGRCLLCDILAEEDRDGRRLVATNASFAAYVPFFARWPYEVHVTARRHLGDLTELSDVEAYDLARVLHGVLRAYDRLFDRPFPYVMAFHQRPGGGGDHAHYHFHVEFYPPLRSETRLKFLAGSELGAGMFINDTLAEESAARLRAHCPPDGA